MTEKVDKSNRAIDRGICEAVIQKAFWREPEKIRILCSEKIEEKCSLNSAEDRYLCALDLSKKEILDIGTEVNGRFGKSMTSGDDVWGWEWIVANFPRAIYSNFANTTAIGVKAGCGATMITKEAPGWEDDEVNVGGFAFPIYLTFNQVIANWKKYKLQLDSGIGFYIPSYDDIGFNATPVATAALSVHSSSEFSSFYFKVGGFSGAYFPFNGGQSEFFGGLEAGAGYVWDINSL